MRHTPWWQILMSSLLLSPLIAYLIQYDTLHLLPFCSETMVSWRAPYSGRSVGHLKFKFCKVGRPSDARIHMRLRLPWPLWTAAGNALNFFFFFKVCVLNVCSTWPGEYYANTSRSKDCVIEFESRLRQWFKVLVVRSKHHIRSIPQFHKASPRVEGSYQPVLDLGSPRPLGTPRTRLGGRSETWPGGKTAHFNVARITRRP